MRLLKVVSHQLKLLAKLIKECILKKLAHFSMDGEQKFVRLFS